MSTSSTSPTPERDEIAMLKAENTSLAARIKILEEKLRLATHQQFAPKSEKLSSLAQLHLFNEAEALNAHRHGDLTMAEPALKLRSPVQPGREFATLDALMAELAGGARTGTRAVLLTTPEAAHWPALERELGQWVRQARDLDAVSLKARSVALLRRVDASIARVADGPHRQRAFRQCITSFDNARSAWLTFAPADTVARHLYAVLVWYGAWHVLAAGLPVAELRRIIPDPSATPPRPARPAGRAVVQPQRRQLTACGRLGPPGPSRWPSRLRWRPPRLPPRPAPVAS